MLFRPTTYFCGSSIRRKGFKMATFTFRGLMAPAFTAFNSNMTVNLTIIPQYAEYLAEKGIMGILVNGTTGEGMSLNVSERKQTAEAWVQAVKTTKQHLMIQIGGCPLPDVLELAIHAESIGVHSILCLPDLYMKPSTPDELISYLQEVCQAAPKTPFLYYHIPSFTHVNIHMGQFLNKVANNIPNFHGIKFTSTVMDEGLEAIGANGGKFAVFLGADQIMAGAYALGFDSAIATSLNMFPQFGIKILECIKENRVQEARQTQNLLNEIITAVVKNGKWVPTMKVAMNSASPLNVGEVRSPLTRLTVAQINQMKQDLKK